MHIIAAFDKVIFCNADSKYTIVRMKTADRMIPEDAKSPYKYRDHLIRFTAVGYDLPQTDAIQVELDGEWVEGKFGVELRVEQWQEIVPPTIEGISRPVLLPFGNVNGQLVFGAAEIMHECGTGIYVTGFNGGNCNPTTGNFSYGIEGFAFRNGKITHPVREMVITGNMLTLWSRLIHAGNDARACTRWQIPSLSFEKVDFSG